MTERTPPTPDWEQLGRYLAGESSPDEAATIQRWLHDHPRDAEVIAELDSAGRKAVVSAHVDVEAALARVKARVRSQSRTIVRRFMGFAAAAVLLLSIGIFMSWRSRSEAPVATVRTYSTGVGQRNSVELEDGSRITMGPASRIEVRGRDVVLAGEAFFDVEHDDERPFVVRAGDVVIRDLGTEFTVHNDPSEPVRVVVQEGAVELTGAGASTATLHPGDVGIVTRTGVVQAERGAATADDLAWTEGRLLFRNAPVGELGADLRRWYGVELRVTDSTLLNRHFTGSFVAGEPVSRVLDAIAIALGARVEVQGDTAFVRPATPAR
jgi:transmembrane sensor